MCLYPRFIKNKRYQGYLNKSPKKGAASAVPCDDYRKLYVPIGCGECYECRRQKAQAWRVRLCEEIKTNKYAYFVTLTFTNEDLIKLGKEYNIITKGNYDPNEIATKATRLFLERWRKKNKKSLKHWLITELGHENTERIHLHGIIFPEFEINNDYLSKIWKYGRTDIGEYCNIRTINYIVKYVTKIDIEHKEFKSVILCSAGLGEQFTKTFSAKQTYKYRPNNSIEYYTLPNGYKVSLPIYYRNKLYTQKERDQLWTERLDKQIIFVNGIKIDISTEEGQKYYLDLIEEQQKWNTRIGYGSTEWKKDKYIADIEKLNN